MRVTARERRFTTLPRAVGAASGPNDEAATGQLRVTALERAFTTLPRVVAAASGPDDGGDSGQCWSSSPPLSRIAESAAKLTSALADMNAAIAVDVPNVSNR